LAILRPAFEIAVAAAAAAALVPMDVADASWNRFGQRRVWQSADC